MRFFSSSFNFKGFKTLFTNSTSFLVSLKLSNASCFSCKYLHFSLIFSLCEFYTRRCRLKSTCFCYSLAHTNVFPSLVFVEFSQPSGEKRKRSKNQNLKGKYFLWRGVFLSARQSQSDSFLVTVFCGFLSTNNSRVARFFFSLASFKRKTSLTKRKPLVLFQFLSFFFDSSPVL